MTKHQIENLLKKLNTTQNTRVLRVNRSAPLPEQRALLTLRARDLCNSISAYDLERRSIQDWPQKLLNAARFVIDVNGDKPSMGQLQHATTTGERAVELRDLIDELKAEAQKVRAVLCHYRYEVVRNGFVVEYQVDTLDQLEEHLRRNHSHVMARGGF